MPFNKSNADSMKAMLYTSAYRGNPHLRAVANSLVTAISKERDEERREALALMGLKVNEMMMKEKN